MKTTKIEKNKIWELTYIPKGKKSIGVKWVYKTKYNPSGEVDRFKVRLVAKGCKEKPENTILRCLLLLQGLALQEWLYLCQFKTVGNIFQMDVKSTF